MATTNQNLFGQQKPNQQSPIISSAMPNMTTQGVPQTSSTGQIQSATGYQAAQLGTPTDWRVDDNQTVQGQIQGIIAQNSPLMQRAQAQAMQQMNSRGLLNSAMGITAGQSAVYDAATPIATADAQTYGKAASYNADMRNQFAARNQDALNTAGAFNAGAANTAAGTNAQNQSSQTVTQMNNDTQRALGQLQSSTNLQLGRMEADTAIGTARISADSQQRVAQTNAQSAQAVAQLNGVNQQAVERIRGEYSELINASESASALYQQLVQSMAQIQMSDLSSDGKGIAMENIQANMRELLNTMSVINGIPNLQNFYTPPTYQRTTPQTGTYSTNGSLAAWPDGGD